MQFKNDEQLGMNGQESKDYIKLKDKESIRGVFRGDIFEYRQHWIGNRSYVCGASSNKPCEHCAQGAKSTFRFRLNFLVKDPNAPQGYVPKIFEQGYTVYGALRSLAQNGYDLEKTIVIITRQGSGQNNTTYSILPIPNNPVLHAQSEKQIAQIKLHDLANINDVNTQQNEPAQSMNQYAGNGNQGAAYPYAGNYPPVNHQYAPPFNEDVPF